MRDNLTKQLFGSTSLRSDIISGHALSATWDGFKDAHVE